MPKSRSVEERVKELEEIVGCMFNMSCAFILFKDDANRFMRVNQNFADLFHVKPEQMVGTRVSQWLTDAAMNHKYLEDDREVIRTGKTKRGIIESFVANGGTIWCRTSKRPWQMPDGRTGVMVFAMDITREKELSQELDEVRNLINKFHGEQ